MSSFVSRASETSLTRPVDRVARRAETLASPPRLCSIFTPMSSLRGLRRSALVVLLGLSGVSTGCAGKLAEVRPTPAQQCTISSADTRDGEDASCEIKTPGSRVVSVAVRMSGDVGEALNDAIASAGSAASGASGAAAAADSGADSGGDDEGGDEEE